MTNRDEQYLAAILREINILQSLVEGYSEEKFLASERTQRAVSMTLLNIGELVKNISDEVKAKHPLIPWKEISGMRDVAAHKYHTLRMERVWDTVKLDIPEFHESLKKLI